jgi:two-component system, cell cycle response regulator DivK
MAIENRIKNIKQKTILLVEDHKYNLLVLKKMLEGMGIVVISAENGKDAIEICRQNNELDLILMDLKMPVMDGYHALEEIKKLRPGIRIIAETAYALAGDEKKILAAGFDDYLSKPITKENLVTVITRNLL